MQPTVLPDGPTTCLVARGRKSLGRSCRFLDFEPGRGHGLAPIADLKFGPGRGVFTKDLSARTGSEAGFEAGTCLYHTYTSAGSKRTFAA